MWFLSNNVVKYCIISVCECVLACLAFASVFVESIMFAKRLQFWTRLRIPDASESDDNTLAASCPQFMNSLATCHILSATG